MIFYRVFHVWSTLHGSSYLNLLWAPGLGFSLLNPVYGDPYCSWASFSAISPLQMPTRRGHTISDIEKLLFLLLVALLRLNLEQNRTHEKQGRRESEINYSLGRGQAQHLTLLGELTRKYEAVCPSLLPPIEKQNAWRTRPCHIAREGESWGQTWPLVLHSFYFTEAARLTTWILCLFLNALGQMTSISPHLSSDLEQGQGGQL